MAPYLCIAAPCGSRRSRRIDLDRFADLFAPEGHIAAGGLPRRSAPRRIGREAWRTLRSFLARGWSDAGEEVEPSSREPTPR